MNASTITTALLFVAFAVIAAGVPMGLHFVLLDHRHRLRAAIRAERLARPAEQAPIFVACCETWWLTRGRDHERTCLHITKELD